MIIILSRYKSTLISSEDALMIYIITTLKPLFKRVQENTFNPRSSMTIHCEQCIRTSFSESSLHTQRGWEKEYCFLLLVYKLVRRRWLRIKSFPLSYVCNKWPKYRVWNCLPGLKKCIPHSLTCSCASHFFG